MPLIGPKLKKTFEATIFSALQREYASDMAKGGQYASDVAAHHKKLAAAIADIAVDIVTAITTDAMVMPGQSVVGAGGGIPGPMSGATVSPGTIS